jgi:hypothetical protein
LGLLNDGKLTRDFAAMAIAHAMFIHGLDKDPLSEEITMIAGELESPNTLKKRQELWRKLRETVNELPSF